MLTRFQTKSREKQVCFHSSKINFQEREHETLMCSFHVTQYTLLKARFQRERTQRKTKMMSFKHI